MRQSANTLSSLLPGRKGGEKINVRYDVGTFVWPIALPFVGDHNDNAYSKN